MDQLKSFALWAVEEVIKSRLTMTVITMLANYTAAHSGLPAAELTPLLVSLTTTGAAYIAGKSHTDAKGA